MTVMVDRISVSVMGVLGGACRGVGVALAGCRWVVERGGGVCLGTVLRLLSLVS